MLVQLIKTEGVTFSHGVPTLLQRRIAAAKEAQTDLAGLKMIVGGSELSHALVHKAQSIGADVFAGGVT